MRRWLLISLVVNLQNANQHYRLRFSDIDWGKQHSLRLDAADCTTSERELVTRRLDTSDRQPIINMCDWRDQLLRGIDMVPKPSARGVLVVFGENAHPVVHGADPNDILLAAAELGAGRMVVCSSRMLVNGKMEGTDKLLRNIKGWLTKGRYKYEETEVMVVRKHRPKINPGVKILLYTGGEVTRDMERDYTHFVENGGALLYGNYQNALLIKGKSHEDIPLSGLLLKAGIAFTDKFLRIKTKGFPVQSQTCDGHVPHQLQKSLGRVNGLGAHGIQLAKNLNRLPPDIVKERFSDHLMTLHQKYENEIEMSLPDGKKKVKAPHQIALLHLVNLMAHHRIKLSKLPGVHVFPGDFKLLPPLQCTEVSLKSQYKDVLATGFYLPAGNELGITIVSEENGPFPWLLQIGCHSDVLYKKDYLERFPSIVVKTRLVKKEMRVFSPSGGLVYFHSPLHPARLTVRLDNVVPAPFYNKTDPNARSLWRDSRGAPGLWADIVGEFIAFSVPSEVVRDIEDPRELMDWWDSVAAGQHDLRGTNPRRARKQWIVADQQPVAGSMHAGYPIVTHMNIAEKTHDNFVFNIARKKTHGSWGLFHEIGHNMQRNMWTFEGTREVSNNIFSLYSSDTATDQRLWIHPWMASKLNKAKTYLSSGADFKEWRTTPGLALVVYMQLAHHLGWEAYKKVFREYEILADSDVPKEDDEKIAQWIGRFSVNSGYNLCPLFEFWGFPIEPAVERQLVRLPMFLPDDEITQLSPNRFRRIMEKYGDSVLTEVSGCVDSGVKGRPALKLNYAGNRPRAVGKYKKTQPSPVAPGAASKEISFDVEEVANDNSAESYSEDECPGS